tara:strand:+ start:305 stop:640 length:336 start_codon:yes stop_codon:yes gene_type:complete
MNSRTGRIIWTEVPSMGGKIRPCVVICSLSKSHYFYVPLSSQDYNTIWQVPVRFKNKISYANLKNAFMSTTDMRGRAKDKLTPNHLQSLFEQLNRRMEESWSAFIGNYGVV